jgi:putative Mg2+ transporter-C (MgtC) family protein
LELFDLESLTKLLLAAVLGAAVGVERGTHGRPAGLRTHSLVCVASTLLIIVSRAGAMSGLTDSGGFTVNIDPSRMAAGIVTGIGFLGAGAILRVGDDLIRGLTTAACIWFVAAIGVAVGVGAYGLAAFASAAALVILIVLDQLEHVLGSVVYRNFVLVIKKQERETVEATVKDLLKQHKMRIQQVTYEVDNRESTSKLSFYGRISARIDRSAFISVVAGQPGVLKVKWS